jgi:hypothetical protein
LIDFLTYYYKLGTEPFRSLSALPDEQAISIMQELCDESLFGARFKDPVQYLRNRRRTEQWVREEFIAKGGRPREAYPIPMVLGTSKWLVKHAPKPGVHGEIRIPLSVFAEHDVSFTIPDSMVSRWLAREKPIEYYQPEYHGKVFTLAEILAIVESKGLPEEGWKPGLPSDLAPYIEAQVWNHQPLVEYKSRLLGR